jgi:hypothetical protein
LKNKFIKWAERAADSGNRFPLIENAKYYAEGHALFLETIEKVKRALDENDDSEYNFNGMIAKIIQEEKITDKDEIAN